MQNKLRELYDSLAQSISEQQWAQELKAKWDELDAQSKLYLKVAGTCAGVLFVLFSIVNSIWSVHQLKNELADRRKLLTYIQNSTDELRKLQNSVPLNTARGGAGGDSTPWKDYFESLATSSGVDKANVSLSAEKPGNTGDQAKESLFDVDLKHVNIKQILNFAVSLENGQRPAKIRNLSINTKGDTSGYMDATFAVSGFTMMVTSK